MTIISVSEPGGESRSELMQPRESSSRSKFGLESEPSVGNTTTWGFSVMTESSLDERPPSADTVREATHGRELLNRGVIHRGRFREAVLAADSDRAQLARHRKDCHQAVKEEDRAKAAAWKREAERRVQIWELKWQLQDPLYKQALHFGESREGRIMPSPILIAPEESAENGLPGTPSEQMRRQTSGSSGLKDGSSRARRPLHVRMKSLRRNAARRRRKSRSGRLSATSDASDSGLDISDTDLPSPDSGSFAMFRRAALREAHSASASSPKGLGRPGTHDHAYESGRESMASMGSNKSVVGDFTDRDAIVLTEAFSRHDEDHSGSLDQAELVECLDCMGLRPKTGQERKELRQLIWNLDRLEFSFQEFSKEVVPSVRQKLMELRYQRLSAFFREVDVYSQGSVTVQETLNTLRRHGVLVREEVCDEAYGAFHGVIERQKHNPQTPQSDDSFGNDGALTPPPATGWKEASLNLDEFIEFARILEEHTDRDASEQFARTAQLHGVGPEEEDYWRHDLVEFERMFHEYEPVSGHYGSPSGILDEVQFSAVVRESGYMPRGKQKHLAHDLYHKVQHSDGTIGFSEFLAVIRKLRDLDRDRLRRIVDIHMPEKSGMVATSDVSDLLRDCSIVARNSMERAEIAALIEESQSSGGRTMGREDVVILFQRIAAKLRIMRHERERQYVLSVGWTEQHYIEFRAAFLVFDEDMSGVLERNEVVKAVESLKGHYWQTSHNMNLMFSALHIDSHNKDMKVDFLTFLRLLKMLDEIEARREKGASFGFSRDRTDKLFGCFQALEPESSGTVRRDTVMRAITGATARWLAKAQIDEVLRQIGQEPLQVEFVGFLRALKVVEALMEPDLEECITDLINWQQAKAKHEQDEARRRPSLLRLIRDDGGR